MKEDDFDLLKNLNRKLSEEFKREFVDLLGEYRRRLAIEDAEAELIYRIQDLSELLKKDGIPRSGL